MLLKRPLLARARTETPRRLGVERLEPRWILSGNGTDLFVPAFELAVGTDDGSRAEVAAAAESPIINLPVTSDPDVQQMPSIAVDPLDADHLVVAYMDHSLVSTPGYAGIGVSVSRDAGDSWEHTSIPLPEDFDGGAANAIVRFDDQGQVYVSFMAATFLGERPALTNPDVFNPERNASDREFGFQSNNGIFVARSDDGGMTWNDPSTVVSHEFEGEDVFFEILPDIAIDTFPLLPDGQVNPYYGNLYVVWSRLYTPGSFPGHPEIDGGIDIMLAVSSDGGVSWETRLQEKLTEGAKPYWATVIEEPLNTSGIPGLGHVDQSHVTVGPEGDIYVSHYGSGDFVVHHSTDGGASFTKPNHETGEWIVFGTGLDTFVDIEGLPNNGFRTQVMRAIIADPARPGTVYAVELDQSFDDLGNEVDPADVLFGRSSDYGQTWQTGFQLGPTDADVLNDDNDGQLATGRDPDEVISGQAMARPAINAQGDVGVIWYDTRGDPADHLLDVYGTLSTDGGQSFSSNFCVSDVSFDADEGSFTDAVGRENFYLGDFIGLAMANDTVYAAWTDTRCGNQDIFFARYSIDPAPAPLGDRYEPNETRDSPTELGRVVQQYVPKLVADPGDEDWFRLEAAATGEVIVAAVSDGQEPPMLELWDETGTTRLATGKDVLDEAGDVIEHEVRFPGDAGQTFQVRVLGPDSSGSNTDRIAYSLRLQSLTADLGKRVFARLTGTIDVGGGALYKVEAAAAGSLAVELLVGENVQGDLDLQILDLETFTVLAPLAEPPTTVASVEPNDSILQAGATKLVGVGSVRINGFIGDGDYGGISGDYDFYSFEAGTSQRVSINLDPLENGLDSMIALYDSAGELLEVVDSGSSGDSESLIFQTKTEGTYFVAVMAWMTGFPGDPFVPGTGAGVGSTGEYSLSITTRAVGPGAIKQADLPTCQGDAVLILVSGQEGSSGDFTLELTNRDQFTTPDSATLLFPAGDGPSQAAVGDFNADGNLDVVVANALSDTISVLLGNGNGTFQAPRQFPVGAYMAPQGDIGSHLPTFRRGVVVADFDGDEIADVAVTNFASSDVSVLLGRGDGTFEPQRRFDATATPYDLAVGDIDGDGIPDLVVVDAPEQADPALGKAMITVATLLGRGDGTFKPQLTEQVTAGEIYPGSAVEIADLDNDGNNDLVISGSVHFNISILLGNGDGTYTHGGDFEAERLGAGLAVADVNGDEILDVVNVNFEECEASVLLGQGDGTFQRAQQIVTGQAPAAVEIVDFGSQVELADGSIGLGPPDGKPDLVVANSGVQLGFQAIGPPKVVMLPGVFDFDEEGDFVLFGPALELAAAEAPHDVDVHDFDGDGTLDVAVVDRDGMLVIFGTPPNIVANNTPETARDLGTLVHLVDQTQTIVPGHEDAYFTLTVPRETVRGAGHEIVDFSALFEATEGAGLQMELLDSAGNRLGSGERFRVHAAQGTELLLHIFGVEASDGSRGSGAYTLVIDVLPQVVSVEAQSLLPGVGGQPGGPTTSLVLAFQGDRFDPASAEDPSHYVVRYFGSDGLPGTADDRIVPIGGVNIDRPIVYNPGANVEVSSGLTYPTAVRQTVTLLFGEPLPPGSYAIELSSAVQAAAFNEMELELLTDPANFAGHPVASLDSGQISEGARIEAVDLVLQAGALGDLKAFETGTPFLTQLEGDLGAMLDEVLSAIGDDPSVTVSIVNQILARLGPSLGELGQRPTSLLVIFLDPVSFYLLDPDGNSATFDLNTNTAASNIPNTSVGVGSNVELVIVPVTIGTYQLELANVPARARGVAVLVYNTLNQILGLTVAMRDGVRAFSIPGLQHTPGPAIPFALAEWAPPQESESFSTPQWTSPPLSEGDSTSTTAAEGHSSAALQSASLHHTPLGVSGRGGEELPPPPWPLEWDADGDGKLSLEEIKHQIEVPQDVLGGIFTRADQDGDGELSPEEYKAAESTFIKARKPGNPNGDDQGGESGSGASDGPDEDTAAVSKEAVSREHRGWPQTASTTGVDPVVDDGGRYYSILLRSAPSSNVSLVAHNLDGAKIAESDGHGQPSTPEQPQGVLIELIRLLWSLLARGLRA